MPKIGWGFARVLSFILYYSGGLRVFERLDRRSQPGPRSTVLNYHRVAYEKVGYHDVAVSPKRFRDHLDHMVRRGYAFLTLEEYQSYLAGKSVLQRDSVLITFDDGYRDNYTNAFPMLRERGIPAAVFLCTGPIDQSGMLWWDRVARAVASIREADVKVPDSMPDIPEHLSILLKRGLSGGDRRASHVIGRLVDALKAHTVADREAIIVAIERLMPRGDTGAAKVMLTWPMVIEMNATGIGLGAHSVTHPAFSELDAAATEAEVIESKRAIESHVNSEVTAFAYPYGKDSYVGHGANEALRAAGFHWAYTTENGRNDPSSDPYALRRNGIRDVPHYVLAVRLAGVFEHPALAGLRARLEGRRKPDAHTASRTA